jgi:hypothetical protein
MTGAGLPTKAHDESAGNAAYRASQELLLRVKAGG